MWYEGRDHTLLLLAALSAPAATFYLIVAGLGGEADYDQRFKMWAEDMDGSLKKAGGDSNVDHPERRHARPDPRAIRELRQKAKPADGLVVMLVGHGTYDGTDYKFNIPGPDLTAKELSAFMDRVPAARQLVVVMTSCSGGAIENLRRPNRVVITATKTGGEKNATTFARYWAEALREPAADVDKNEPSRRWRLSATRSRRPRSFSKRRSAWPPSIR